MVWPAVDELVEPGLHLRSPLHLPLEGLGLLPGVHPGSDHDPADLDQGARNSPTCALDPMSVTAKTGLRTALPHQLRQLASWAVHSPEHRNQAENAWGGCRSSWLQCTETHTPRLPEHQPVTL